MCVYIYNYIYINIYTKSWKRDVHPKDAGRKKGSVRDYPSLYTCAKWCHGPFRILLKWGPS